MQNIKSKSILRRIANLGKVWFWICLRQFSPGPTDMKRSSWALDAYYHTHVETWLGSGWGGQLLDMWRGKVAIGGRLGRRAGGRKWPGEWRGPSSKGVIDVYVLCNHLTLTLPWWCEQTNGFLTFPLTPLWAASQVKTFRFHVRRALAVYLSQFWRKNGNATKDFLSEMNRAFHCQQVVWSVWAERRISATPQKHTIAFSLFFI